MTKVVLLSHREIQSLIRAIEHITEKNNSLPEQLFLAYEKLVEAEKQEAHNDESRTTGEV